MSELEDFYNRHIKVSNDDIPDEEEITVVQQAPKKQVEKTNSIADTEVIPQKDDGGPVSGMPFDEDINDVPVAEATPDKPADIDDLLDDETPQKEVQTPVKKEAEILESPKDPMKTETSDSDLDSLLEDIL